MCGAKSHKREKIDIIKAEIVDSKFRGTKRLESIAYAHELQEQRRIQETRKTLAPFLMFSARGGCADGGGGCVRGVGNYLLSFGTVQ